MSETEMNFGPDWLRALSDSGTNKNSNSNSNNLNNSQNNSSANNSSFKYKLVEYRYGREEMLALFDSKVKMQPKMKEFTGLVADKCQTPLSLIPMTEEEQRIWSKSLNSDIVMRLAGKTSVNNQNGPNSPNPILNGGLQPSASERNAGNLERGNSLDNRGLNLRASGLRGNMGDRGRGRSRTFMRNSSYEDETTENYSSTSGDNLRTREYRPKNNFDRSNAADDLTSSIQREKPTFERQFSKPPPINSESNDPESANSTAGSRLNFRNKPQSLDSQPQNDPSWRSNRPNLRNDNSRRNLDWRNKYRSDETNNSTTPTNTTGEWKRSSNNNTNDRWRNDNDGEDNELDRRRFNFNKSSMNKDKSSWDDHDDKRNNLPEWSLDDDAVLDRKFGTFDASGQFREDPIVESFGNSLKDNHHSTNVIGSKTDDWFIGKDKLDNTAGKLMNSKDDKPTSYSTSLLSNNEHLINSMLGKSSKSIIEEKNIKYTPSMFADLLGKKSSSIIQPHVGKSTLKNDLDSNDLEAERQKYTQNFISTLIQRQSNQQPQNDNLSSLQQLKQASEKDLTSSNQESFFDNFNLNSMNINQSAFAQLSHFNKNQQTDQETSRLFENILEVKSKLQQQKMNNNQIDSTNDKLTKLTLGESKKNDVQNLLDSIASKQQQQQQHNFGLNPLTNSEVQMFSLTETEKLLKEINKNNSSNPTSVVKQVASTNLNSQSQQQQTFKNIYSNEEHQFGERNTEHSLVNQSINQWTAQAAQINQHQQHQQQQPHNESDELKDRHRGNVFPPNHEYGQRWYYQDPQKEVQGPFSSNDMLDWYKGGYFTMDLLVRRGCDEVFCKLGELIKQWKRIPFLPGDDNPSPLVKTNNQQPQTQSQQSQPEINVTPQMNPAAINLSSMVVQPGLQISNQALFQMISPTTQDFSNAMRNANQQIPMPIVLNQQQLHEQQKQMFFRHMQQQPQFMMMDPVMQAAQFRQLFSQLNPNQLNQLQQQHQQLQQQQQQQPQATNQQAPPHQPPQPQTTQQSINSEDSQQIISSTNVAANNGALNINPMIKQILAKSAQSNMWNLNGEQVMTVTAIEEMQRQEQDRREIEEKQRKLLEEQERRKIEEIQLIKLEEERKRMKKLEEQKKMREEEERLIMLENKRKEKELEQEMIKKQLNRQKQLEQEQNQRLQQQQSLEQAKQHQQQAIVSEMNYHQHQATIITSQQQQITQQSKPATSQPQKKKGWAVISTDQPTSLDEIQKLQESNEREERLKQTQHMLQIIQDNQKLKGWSNLNNKVSTAQPIKTLDEIQREESERLTRMKKIEEENLGPQMPVQSVGVWGNAANNLQWKAASPLNIWGNQSSNQDFKDFSSDNLSAPNEPWSVDSSNGQSTSNKTFQNSSKSPSTLLNSEQSKQLENSAFQLNSTNSQSGQQQQVNSKKNKTKTGKDELSSNSSLTNSTPSTTSSKKTQKMPTDEFSKWCIEALSQFKDAIDIPTFISFLKDVESPHDVNDYVFSYLGENKDSKEFSKRFIEKRSFYKNQAKKAFKENEEMFGPAPAILPASVKVQNKVEESEFSIFKSGKRKKKSGKKNESEV